MAGTYPVTPVPSGMALRLTAPNVEILTHNRKRRVCAVAGGAQWFGFRYDYPPLDRSEFGPLWAWLQTQRGSAGTFSLFPVGLGTPLGVATGTPVTRNRQNQVLDSDNYGGASWTKGALITQGGSAAGASPDLTEMEYWHSDSTSVWDSLQQIVGSFAAHNILSCYVRAGSAGATGIRLYDHVTAASHGVILSWTAGVPSIGSSLNIDGSGVEYVGNFVYRVWVYVNATARGIVGNGRRVIFYPNCWPGDLGVYVWRFQVEDGFTVPGYRVQTTAAAVGGAQAGRTLYAAGWTPATAGILKAGDCAQVPGHTKVYTVTADANSDANGVAAIQISPALLSSPADGSAITVRDIPYNVRLATDLAEVDADSVPHYGLTLEFVESY
jgi:hypothetical protein